MFFILAWQLSVYLPRSVTAILLSISNNSIFSDLSNILATRLRHRGGTEYP